MKNILSLSRIKRKEMTIKRLTAENNRLKNECQELEKEIIALNCQIDNYGNIDKKIAEIEKTKTTLADEINDIKKLHQQYKTLVKMQSNVNTEYKKKFKKETSKAIGDISRCI